MVAKHNELDQQNVNPKQQNVSPSQQNVSPKQQNVSPSQQNVSPTQQNVSPDDCKNQCDKILSTSQSYKRHPSILFFLIMTL